MQKKESAKGGRESANNKYRIYCNRWKREKTASYNE